MSHKAGLFGRVITLAVLLSFSLSATVFPNNIATIVGDGVTPTSGPFFVYLPFLSGGDPGTESLVVTPEEGGVLTSPNKQVQVEIPAGAVSSETVVTFHQLPSQVIPGYQITSTFFELVAQDRQGRPVSHFEDDLQVTVNYGASGVKEDKIALYFLTGNVYWQRVASTVNPEANQVVASLNHFTQFAVLAQTSTPWGVGRDVGLCQGTTIHQTPGGAVHTTVPEDNWLVRVTGFQIFNNQIWWNTDRKVLDQLPTSGTGWVSQDQQEASCQGDETGSTWAVGSLVGLCAGTEIRHGPGLAWNVHTIVPVDFWAVKVMGGPVDADGERWWDTSRFAAGDPSGGTGWVSQDQYEASCSLSNSDLEPPVIHWVDRWLSNGRTNFRVRVTDNVGVANVVLIFNGTNVALNYIGGDLYEITLSVPLTQISRYQIVAVDVSGNVATFPPGQHINIRGYMSRSLGRHNLICGVSPSSTYSSSTCNPPTQGSGGDPINTIIGNFVYSTIDQSVAGIGDTGIALERYYNSLPNEEQGILRYTLDGDTVKEEPFRVHVQPFGSGWSFLPSLLVMDNDLLRGVQARYPDGHTVNFARSGDGSFTPVETRVYDELLANESGYCLKQKDLTQYCFDADGRVVNKTDRNSNTLTYIYSSDRLDRIENSAGRWADFDYNSDGLISDIYAPENVHLQYEYTGDLLTEFVDAKNQTWGYEYDAAGRLEAIITPNGYPSLRLTYNELGRATEQIIGDTNRYTFTYDDVARTTIIRDAYNNPTTHVYDAQYRLIRVIDALGEDEEYGYSSDDHRTSFRDKADRLWSYTYDEKGNRRSEDGPLGWHRAWTYDEELNVPTQLVERVDSTTTRTFNFDYDAQGNLTEVCAPLLENCSTVTYATGRGLPTDIYDFNQKHTHFVYDSQGDLTSITNAESETTHFDHDGLGRLAEFQLPKGSTYLYQLTYDLNNNLTDIEGPLDYHVHYEHDPNNNLTDIVDPGEVVTHFEYNQMDLVSRLIGNYRPGMVETAGINVTTEYEYYLNGQLRFVTEPRDYEAELIYDPLWRIQDIFDFEEAHTHLEYDVVGNLTEITDDNNHTTQLEYDDLNRRTALTNADEETISFTYNIIGFLTDILDAREEPTHFDVDVLGRATRVLDAMDGEWFYGYDNMGNVLTHTDALSHTTTFTYDNVYRLDTITDAEDNVSNLDWDANGNLIQFMDANNHRRLYGYNELDQLTSFTNAEDETTEYRYDLLGNITQLIEADDIVTLYDYDSLYRLISVTANLAEGIPADNDTNVVTQYVWDASSNLTQIINAEEQITRFEHDGMGHLTTEINPEDNTWEYTYQKVGNLATRTDANGKLTSYSYYADDQLRRVDYENGDFVEFEYDDNNNPTVITNTLGVTTWAYDPLNRLTDQVDPLNRTIHLELDSVGNLTEIVYPDGNSVAYTYLDNNWLETVIDPEEGVITYERDAVGNVLHILNPNSTVTDLSYDKADRVTNLVNQQIVGARKTNSAFAYTYNDIGQVTQIINEYGYRQPSEITETYTYDGLHRLAGMENSEGVAMTYLYDRVGDRQSWQTNDDLTTETPWDGFITQYEYNKASQLITATVDSDMPAGDTTILHSYDANGNLINKEWTGPQGPPTQGVDYAFDPENRLIEAQNYQLGGGDRIDRSVTTLEYDGLGRRLVQTYDPKTGADGQKRVEYTFAGLDPIAEYDMLNGQRDNFYRGDGGRIVMMHNFKSGAPGQRYWYDYNFKGDVVGLTKHSGQAIHNYRYDPYGGPIADSFITEPANHYTLTGKEYDTHGQQPDGNIDGTSLVYFGARYYDPEVGRWLTQDTHRGTLANPMSLHRYMYNYGDPINHIDLYGYWGMDIGLGGLGSLGVGGGVDVSLEFEFPTWNPSTWKFSIPIEPYIGAETAAGGEERLKLSLWTRNDFGGVLPTFDAPVTIHGGWQAANGISVHGGFLTGEGKQGIEGSLGFGPKAGVGAYGFVSFPLVEAFGVDNESVRFWGNTYLNKYFYKYEWNNDAQLICPSN